MKFSRVELLKLGGKPISFEETLSFPSDTFFALSNLRSLHDVRVWGDARYYSEQERLDVSFTVEGMMIVPCALTNEDVEYPFCEERDVVFAFTKPEEEDVIEVKKDVVDLMPVIFETIICEVPLKVVAEGADINRCGDGWEVIRDDQLHSTKDEFDPRLSKLRDLLENEEK